MIFFFDSTKQTAGVGIVTKFNRESITVCQSVCPQPFEI